MLIVANHKMNLSYQEIQDYLKKVQEIGEFPFQFVICPTNIYLPLFDQKNYKLGSQYVSDKENGSYTGEISAAQLKSLNVSYCLVGHSERRLYYNETNDAIVNKLSHLLKQKITPILCIGETKEERMLGQTKQILKEQLENTLFKINNDQINEVILAYEPRWAIGSGEVPQISEVKEIVDWLKKIVQTEKNVEIKVLYGGSIDEKNFSSFTNINNLDGCLIGGFSLHLEKWKQLFKI